MLNQKLLNKLHRTLLECVRFDNHQLIDTVFTTGKLSIWRYQIPSADSPQERVELLVKLLTTKYTDEGENGLALFINALAEKADPGDACHKKLNYLVSEITQVLKAEPPTEAMVQRLKMIREQLQVTADREDWAETLVLAGQIIGIKPDDQQAREHILVAKLALQHSLLEPATPRNTNELILPKCEKVMIRIPSGKFLFGEDLEEREIAEFWISQTPVTNGEYSRFVTETGFDPPSHWHGSLPPNHLVKHPVTNITWDNANAYAKWVDASGGRLPTEEEWEKAARGTRDYDYPWGGRWKKGVCNTSEYGLQKTTTVGQFSPDGDSADFGCVDMSGNIWEWTSSWADEDQTLRIAKGGSNSRKRLHAKISSRHEWTRLDWSPELGFRIVISLISSDV